MVIGDRRVGRSAHGVACLSSNQRLRVLLSFLGRMYHLRVRSISKNVGISRYISGHRDLTVWQHLHPVAAAATLEHALPSTVMACAHLRE